MGNSYKIGPRVGSYWEVEGGKEKNAKIAQNRILESLLSGFFHA